MVAYSSCFEVVDSRVVRHSDESIFVFRAVVADVEVGSVVDYGVELGNFACVDSRVVFYFYSCVVVCSKVRTGDRVDDSVISIEVDSVALSDVATDVLKYSEAEIERIGRIGFETARKRNKKLCSVEKSNVLDSSRLWKKVMHRLSEEYPDIELSDMLVDNCAMQIVKNPAQFDVVVTENMFGDILSDEASMITGSIGMIPSSSLGSSTCGLYEPIHGSAPDIAGKDVANPVGTILSAAMMLRFSFDMPDEATAIENAVSEYLDKGYRTADIMSEGGNLVGCSKCGELICENLRKGC